jgi:hypothetical protein
LTTPNNKKKPHVFYFYAPQNPPKSPVSQN